MSTVIVIGRTVNERRKWAHSGRNFTPDDHARPRMADPPKRVSTIRAVISRFSGRKPIGQRGFETLNCDLLKAQIT
eukprot:1979880-Amphidinium_carterae.1